MINTKSSGIQITEGIDESKLKSNQAQKANQARFLKKLLITGALLLTLNLIGIYFLFL